MKKVIILIVVVFAFNVKGHSQVTTDTLDYLRNIVANKAQYVGHPFHVLADTLQLQIKFFSPFAGKAYDKTKETSTSFSFYFPPTQNEMYLTYPKLEIVWQVPLNANQSSVLYDANNGGGWSPAVATFYANAIIGDIRVRE